MNTIRVVGAGLNTELSSSLALLAQKSIKDLPEKEPEDEKSIVDKKSNFNSLHRISREDKTLLNNHACLAIDAAVDAFSLAEISQSYNLEEKSNFAIYMGSETTEHNFQAVEALANENWINGKFNWDKLGKIKDKLNPLEMLRLLSTNQLYHVSKVLNLNGGGYPIRRMSLSGLSALEEACIHIQSGLNHALVVASGNSRNLESLCAFKKMGLLKTLKNKEGIIPSFGSAALILENSQTILSRKSYAEIYSVETIYKPSNEIFADDWLNLYKLLPKINAQDLTIISYDNGIKKIAKEEYKAIERSFPEAKVINYKKYYGYCGKANNLVDMVTTLADERIQVGSNILVNGLGMNAGLGFIYFKKMAHIGGNDEISRSNCN